MAADKSDLEDSSQNKAGRRPQIDPWAAIRMERYLRPVMGETGLSALVEILAGGMPGYFEDLSRVLEPAAKEVPPPSPQASPFPQSVQVAVRHTREIVGSRDDIMELLTKERSALPNDWQSLRRWLATDAADFLEHLQKNGTPPETLVMDTVSLVKTESWENSYWASGRGGLIRLAFRLRRLLETVPDASRGDLWEQSVSQIAEMLSRCHMIGRRWRFIRLWMAPYIHEIFRRGVDLPLEKNTAVAISGFLRNLSFLRNVGELSVLMSCVIAKFDSTKYDDFYDYSNALAVFNSEMKNVPYSSGIIHSFYINDSMIFDEDSSLSVINSMNLASSDKNRMSLISALYCCNKIDEKFINEKLIIMSMAASAFREISSNISLDPIDMRFMVHFFEMLKVMPYAWREKHRRNLLAPLSARLEIEVKNASDVLRKMFRLFVLPDVEPIPDLADGFRRLAIEVAREKGIVIPETMPELLRAALESAFGAEEVARAVREIDALVLRVLALPDDPCALIREVYGPYLENGPLVAAGVMSVARWNRWVRLSRGEGLPADIGLALRTVFAERA